MVGWMPQECCRQMGLFSGHMFLNCHQREGKVKEMLLENGLVPWSDTGLKRIGDNCRGNVLQNGLWGKHHRNDGMVARGEMLLKWLDASR